MDIIRICELKVFAHHGVYQEEKEKGQDFYVNAQLYTDTRKAGKSDNLEDSTNYGAVCRHIYSFLTDHTYDLLEAACENLTASILQTFPLIREVELEIRKPQAPIPLDFGSVSVCIRRGWHQTAIALGSNLGDSENLLQEALTGIREDAGCRLLAVSDFIRTKPYGGVEQPDFLNGACLVDTLYAPEELLDFLHGLEQKAGRERLIHWGPRTLDLDILLYEQQVVHSRDLIIPHADMQNRDFVLTPLAQIAPYWIHPVLGCSVLQLQQSLQKN